MALLGCSCTKAIVSDGSGRSRVKAKMTIAVAARAKVAAFSDILEHASKQHSAVVAIGGTGSVTPRETVSQNVNDVTTGVGAIKSLFKKSHSATTNASAQGKVVVRKTDKFVGSVDFGPRQKQYPLQDINNRLGDSFFVNEELSTSNIYESIDEGVFTGDYTTPFGQSSLIANDDNFIQPSSIATAGSFRYQCEVDAPTVLPTESLLVLRASAPTSNFQSFGPPKYTLSNIKLLDPSDALIVQFDDLIIKGDDSFSTYILPASVNNALNPLDPDYPSFTDTSNYQLTFNVDIDCSQQYPFDDGFGDKGYQDSCGINPLPSDVTQPTPTLNISAIEILSSGALVGASSRKFVPFYSEVDQYGDSISRQILTSTILDSGYNSTIWPETRHSVWTSSSTLDGLSGENTNPSGISVINFLLKERLGDITLTSPGDIADSGKLNIVFSHTPPENITQKTSGAFGMSKRILGFDTASVREVLGDDNWFKVRDVTLKLKAKKAPGSRDYALDVVGYSDDKILNVTPKVGGFLQNPSGVGVIPTNSGIAQTDDLAISAETISDKSGFYDGPSTINPGGDHYQLTQVPVVNSTVYQDFEIPLQIFKDNVTLGRSTDYTMASYFEKLYLDIYPLPSGASLADIRLEVTYSPSNALMLYTLGHNTNTLSHGDVTLFPTGMKPEDDYFNSNIDVNPLSLISEIPQGYESPSTIKTNYSRRWRGGTDDVKTGPYDPLAFDASFENTESLHPFNQFYIDFERLDGNFALSNDYGSVSLSASGELIGDTFANRLINNVGQRFNSTKKYGSSQRSYNSIDYAGVGHVLEGRITDAYKNALILGSGATMNFGSYDDVSQGFSAFARFTPNSNVDVTTGSHTILDNYNGSTGFRLLIDNGFFKVSMYDGGAVARTATDTYPASGYSYPVSLLATYNENENNTLRLYVDNELAASGWSLFRDDSPSFTAASNSSDVIANGSMILSEVGLSIPCKIVTSGEDARERETSIDAFFDSMRMKFWQNGQDYTDDRTKLYEFVNDDINGWYIGDFNYVQFDSAFDQYTTRGSVDYLTHTLSSDGQPYSAITNTDLPVSVNASGLAYHSQIENDMLRFHLDAMPDNDNRDRLWSPLPRIAKTIPRDYKFEERAFVVESVVEHSSDVDIPWPWDGYIGQQKYGPKIIVSLYSRSKDPASFDAPNWGLISRQSHYIHPVNDSLIKISTTFDYNDLIDTESEPWASFDQTRNTTELAHKYFSSDIDEMFVQYDIAYPSGTSFNSTFKLHTVHVGLEQALLEQRNTNDTLNLHASGELIAYGDVNLATAGLMAISGDLNLATSGTPMPVQSGEFNLAVSGAVLGIGAVDMYTHVVGNSTSPLNFNIVGGLQAANGGVNLSVYASPNTPEEIFSETFGEEDTWGDGSFYVNMHTRGVAADANGVANSGTNLFIVGTGIIEPPVGDLNLYINSDQNPVQSTGNLGLYSITNTYFDPSLPFQQTIEWDGQNQGSFIDFSDQEAGVAFLPLDDEIRGVQTICYGDCAYDGTCEQEEISTHGIVWYESACVDGGVIRAFSTYTNPESSGFLTPIPYSGNFYGLRKYTGLVPNALYNITITSKTASDDIIQVPRLIEEWEYGTNDEVNYSGVKIDGDYPLDTIDASGRNPEDHYGKAVDIVDDLMFVGSPMYTMPDDDGYPLEEAGTVFVYRRRPEPSGATWVEHKADWDLEAKLSLPEGFKRDSYVDVEKTFDGVSIRGTQRIWSVNQEGRQLGSSISAYKSGDREIVAVGGPSAKFSRTFEDLQSEPINVAILVVTNEFVPAVWLGAGVGYIDYNAILENLLDKDTLFTYFADPSVTFNVKIVIVEPFASQDEATPDFPAPQPEFITKRQIERHLTYDRTDPDFFTQDNIIFDQLKTLYHEEFPINPNQISSGIPPILGIYVDNSASLRERAVQPAIDRFVDYWKSFTFASGLRSFEDGLPASGYASVVVDISENWIEQSNQIIDDVLSTGNAVENDYYGLFASGVGPEFYQDDVSESNTVPVSGGALFIFENYNSGEWTAIQRIDSPTTLNNIPPDRFAHAVDMSQDGSTMIIGSPYINSAVRVYFRNDDAESQAYQDVGAWLNGARTNNAYLANEYQLWLKRVAESGLSAANESTYIGLTPSGKYQYRSDYDINEYNLSFEYTYSDIQFAGAWQWLATRFVPSPRLGYSVATNEDGSIIAAGRPTDSMNSQNEIPLYYRPGVTQDPDAWFSYVNAGAVSVWNSRDYYPHNKAVQYGRFGNLHEIINRDNDPVGTYDHMGDIYNNAGIEFEKLPFFQTEIPQDAGLMYLITPASGALSNEILDNIEDWLGYGDRHLVIVGNDPLFESSGVYQQSNNIVNNLLRNLGSRMVIQPARNKYEASISGVQYQINAVPSDTPKGTISAVATPTSLVGSGYGDIRLYDDRISVAWNCQEADYIPPDNPFFDLFPPYWTINDKCKPYQEHFGDLRAKWNDTCSDGNGRPVQYENNLPFTYGTYNPGCTKPEGYTPLMPQGEPRPLMVAAEYQEPYDIVYPSSVNVETKRVIAGYRPAFDHVGFALESESGVAFSWSASGVSESGVHLQNIGASPSDSLFFDPDFYNDHDGVIQAKSATVVKVIESPYTAQSVFPIIVEFPIGKSSVVLVSTVATESTESLDSSSGDRNQNMYSNLVGKNANGDSKIAQLGGWTGRQSYLDGYQYSALDGVFVRNGNVSDLNVNMDDLASSQNGYNVAWVANSSGVMSSDDLSKMQQWLDQGDKKLIITYGADPSDTRAYGREPSVAIANAAAQMCLDLGVDFRPLMLPGRNRYALNEFPDIATEPPVTEDGNEITLADTYVSNGFLGYDSSISSYSLSVVQNSSQTLWNDLMIPVDVRNPSCIVHGYFKYLVKDVNYISQDIPRVRSGVDKVTFPAIAGSGYRVFVTTVAESPAESGILRWKAGTAFSSTDWNNLRLPAINVDEDTSIPIYDVDFETGDQVVVDTINSLGAAQATDPRQDNTTGRPITRSFDVQIPANIDELSIYFEGNYAWDRPISPNPRTPRLLSVSGALVELSEVFKPEPVYEFIEVETVVPERIVTVEGGVDAIQTGSTKYCPIDLDNTPGPVDGNGYSCSGYFYAEAGEDPPIKDGPVVVAQEIYFNRPFDAGLNRSRVTVISDPSLIEGGSILNEQGGINPSLMNFLVSLYPESPNVPDAGRAYDVYDRIVSLERTSPQKLFANTGNSGVMIRFTGDGSGMSNSGVALSSFTDGEQIVDPRVSKKWSILPPELGKPGRYVEYRTDPFLGDPLQLQEGLIKNFDALQYQYGGTAKFSGIYEGEFYSDAPRTGGMPEIMKATRHDYLDFKAFPSGYPGDLFGYSISLFGDKLLIGSPFVAWESEELTDWEAAASGTTRLSGSLSGAVIGHNGGAGAAYLYELTGEGVDVTGREARWELIRKFRPSGINTGQDLTDSLESQAYKYLGLNNYTDAELAQWSTMSDMFGYDVNMEYDLLAISAPGHDFGNTFAETQAPYQRKSFDRSFDIQDVTYTDLGNSGVRDSVGSGTAVLNNGAVFTYQNNITDWGQKQKSWIELQKVIPQGYNARESGVSENDMFGYAIGLSRGLRSDGSYTMAVGSPFNDYATSGDAPVLTDAGAGYTFDAMLRKQPPSVANPDSWINACVYGAKPLDPEVSVCISTENGTVPNERFTATGIVLTDPQGQIFIEASGQDLAPQGYIEHRPYIEAVQGFIVQGDEIYDVFRLTTLGGGPIASGAINLYVGSDGGPVYNNVGMYAGGILGYGSGDMNLMVYNPSGTLQTSTVNMVASGAGFNTEEVFLRVRGKSRRGNQRK